MNLDGTRRPASGGDDSPRPILSYHSGHQQWSTSPPGPVPAERYEGPVADPFIHYMNPRAPAFDASWTTFHQAVQDGGSGQQSINGADGNQPVDGASGHQPVNGTSGPHQPNGVDRQHQQRFGPHDINGTGGPLDGVSANRDRDLSIGDGHNGHNGPNGHQDHASMNWNHDENANGHHGPSGTDGYYRGPLMNSPSSDEWPINQNNYTPSANPPNPDRIGPSPPSGRPFPIRQRTPAGLSPEYGPPRTDGPPPPPAQASPIGPAPPSGQFHAYGLPPPFFGQPHTYGPRPPFPRPPNPMSLEEAYENAYETIRENYGLSREEIWAGFASVLIDLPQFSLSVSTPDLLRAISLLSRNTGQSIMFTPDGGMSATQAQVPELRRIRVGDGRPEECADQHEAEMELFEPTYFKVDLKPWPVCRLPR